VPWTGHPHWRTLVDRAEASGYDGLVVAVDAAVSSNRERDLRNGWTAPPRILSHAHSYALRPGWIARTLRHRRATLRNVDPTPPTLLDFIRRATASTTAHAADVDVMTWDELAWLRERWRGPLAIKGPVSGPDAARMAEIGVDVIVLGNHGGRQLDGVRPALDQLREVLDATGGRIEVVVDGGVRRGADVVKALCLGARACSIGRPWVYGLSAGGTVGVRGVVDLFEAEIRMTMSLLGARSVAELDETLLRTSGVA
jgi:L-lactate dehydrogenase (cytochrome)